MISNKISQLYINAQFQPDNSQNKSDLKDNLTVQIFNQREVLTGSGALFVYYTTTLS